MDHPDGPPVAPPPGWYSDPWYPAQLRWWDGRVWCAQTQPAHPPAPSPTLTVAPPQSAPLAASQGIDTDITDVVAATTPTAVRSEVPYRGRVEAEFDAPLEVARWRVIGNPILAIPHLLILAVLLAVCFCCIYLLFVIDLLVGWLLFAMSARIPLGVYDFLEAMQRYEWRVVTFVFFLREKYPPFSFEASMIDPRDDPARISFLKEDLLWNPAANLWSLIRIVMLVPQIIFGIPLAIGLCAAMIAAFFAVGVTGRWPPGLRRFVLRILFWAFRVNAWAFHLADGYPPFRIG